MTTPSERLAALGLSLPAVAAPVAAYVPSLRVGNQVWTSGQLPFRDGVLPSSGLVGDGPDDVSPAVAKDLAGTAILNAVAAVVAAIDDPRGVDAIGRVLKVTGFVASRPDFTGQPGVVNGASELLEQIFGESGRHVRSAVGVASLPLGSPVELELVVELA